MFNTTPPTETREKILSYGGSTVGKTHSILALAQTLSVIDPTAKVYALDADAGVGKIWKAYFKNLKNFNHIDTVHWSEVEDAINLLEKTVKPNDWICVDMIGKFWEMAQSHYIGEIYGKTASEYLLVARAEAVAAAKLNKPATMPGTDWSVIKKLHNEEFVDRIVTEFPCNFYATTAADPLIAEFDDQKTISLCGAVGFKPDGEKKNIHRFDTVMYLSLFRDGSKAMSTIKDRARPLMSNQPFTNLFVDYDAALKSKGVDGIFAEE